MKNLLTICFCWFALSVWGQQDTTFLYMDSLFQQLPEVLVRGERPVIKGEKGKLIYDVPRIIEKLPVTNAYEVLKELPGVTEQNGTLSLGGLRVTVVVNGKVTTLDKEQLRAMLEGTPVSRIGCTSDSRRFGVPRYIKGSGNGRVTPQIHHARELKRERPCHQDLS